MNFEFTKGKVIGSVVISIILDILFWFTYFLIYPVSPDKPTGTNIFMILFNPLNLILLLGILIVVYIIWSLFQKSKRRY